MVTDFYKKSIFIACLFFAAAVISACGRQESEEIREKAFGIDYTEELAIQHLGEVICGQENVWAITTAKNDFIYKLGFDTGTDGAEMIEWQRPEGNYSIVNVSEQKGILYVQLQNIDDGTFEILRQSADGGLSDVMSIKAEAQENYAVVGSGFFVDSSGNVYLVSGDVVTRFDGEGKQSYTFELGGNICFFQENEEGYAECVTADKEEITLYELTENRAEEKWRFKTAAGQVYGIRSSDKETLCLATDQELLFFDRESGGLQARTDLVKLGVSPVLTGYYDAEEGTLRLYGYSGSGSEGLHFSLLSERDTYDEMRTELVYGVVGGVNADASSSIRTAINTFNQENKDYYVTIKKYNGNLDRLHADMAAGNGPDIIDMVYSEYYESYVKNGYLEDLSPYLEQSQYRDDIIWNVLDAYKIDGGLYVFVPQFRLKGILINPDYEAFVEEWNMETFLELVDKNQWEKDIIGNAGYPENLLRFMLCGRQEDFIDYGQNTASFETEEFTDMLVLCREYAENWQNAKEWTLEDTECNTLCMNLVLGGSFSSYLFYVDIYGREYTIYGYPMVSGQTYGIDPCADSCAIYAGSNQKEGAWEFIESLMWESNQKYLGIADPGFPVRRSVLEEMEEKAKSETVRSGNEMLTITDSEILIMENIIYNGSLSRVSIDRDIWNVIYEETAPYFAGDKSAEETAHVIQSRVRLILEE